MQNRQDQSGSMNQSNQGGANGSGSSTAGTSSSGGSGSAVGTSGNSSDTMQNRQDQSGSMNQGNQSGARTSGSGTAGTSGNSATDNNASSNSNAANSNTATSGITASNSVSASDRRLMRELAYANLAEIDTAKIAQSKTSNDQVRTFAQHMVEDHTKALDQLQQLAQAKGVQLPTAADAKHQAQAKKLSALSGDAFDKQYLAQAGVGDHREAQRLVSRISTQAKDADLKTLANNLLPGIEQHLQMAEQMHGGKAAGQTSSGASGASGSGAGSSGAAGGATNSK